MKKSVDDTASLSSTADGLKDSDFVVRPPPGRRGRYFSFIFFFKKICSNPTYMCIFFK